MASEQLVKHRAKSIHVSRAGELSVFTCSLFRCHVARCAKHFESACDRAVSLYQAGKAKVSQMGFAVFIQQDVTRLNVTVH